MNQVDYYGVVKKELMDYYKKTKEYALSLAQEVTMIDLFSGERIVELVIPSGLRSELIFTRDEIERWQNYERVGGMK